MPPESDARRGYQPLLEEMFHLYPRLVRGVPTVRIRDGYRKVPFLAHGWYLRCHRGIESLLLLDAAGHAEEASPIRRSVIEHNVALFWLAAEGDKILDTIARGHAHDTEKRGNAVAAAKWTSVDPDEFKKVLLDIDRDTLDAHNDNLLTFAKRLEKYGDKHTQVEYLSEITRTHAGYESAASYVDLNDGTLLMQPRDPIWQIPFSTSHILEALLAVQEIFEPKPWEKELELILERYISVTDAVREQEGLRPIDWTTGELVHAESQGPTKASSEEGDHAKGA